jgi:F0F1-type ATP synthase membrane subunit c/vacuolar-type H+-ATPase subunit K
MADRDEEKLSLAESGQILRRVVRLFRPYRRRVLLVAGAILLSSGLGVVNPLLIREIFDDALFVDGGPDTGLLYLLVALMIGIAAIGAGIGVVQGYLAAQIGQNVMRDLGLRPRGGRRAPLHRDERAAGPVPDAGARERPALLGDGRRLLRGCAGGRLRRRRVAALGWRRLDHRRDDRRVHDAPGSPVLARRQALLARGGAPLVVRDVQADLRLPRPAQRGRRHAGLGRARARPDTGLDRARARVVQVSRRRALDAARRRPAHRARPARRARRPDGRRQDDAVLSRRPAVRRRRGRHPPRRPRRAPRHACLAAAVIGMVTQETYLQLVAAVGVAAQLFIGKEVLSAVLAAGDGGGFAEIEPELVALIAVTVALDFAAAIESEQSRVLAELVGRPRARPRARRGDARRPARVRVARLLRPAEAGPGAGPVPLAPDRERAARARRSLGRGGRNPRRARHAPAAPAAARRPRLHPALDRRLPQHPATSTGSPSG